MSNKNRLFGGVYFCSAIAVFASVSSDVIAGEIAIEEARNTLTQIYILEDKCS